MYPSQMLDPKISATLLSVNYIILDFNSTTKIIHTKTVNYAKSKAHLSALITFALCESGHYSSSSLSVVKSKQISKMLREKFKKQSIVRPYSYYFYFTI